MNTLESQKAQIAQLEKDLQAATDLAEQSAAQVTTLTQERDSAIAQRDTAVSERDSARADLATAQATISTQATTITAHESEISTLKAEATTVEKKAAQLLASHGHEPLSLQPDSEGITAGEQTDLVKKYNAISDAGERAAFYAKHKGKGL